MGNKQELYARIKIAGMVFYIPIMLAVGPLGGYFLGDYLIRTFKLPSFVLFISISLGLLAGIFETIRIIRMILKIGFKS